MKTYKLTISAEKHGVVEIYSEADSMEQMLEKADNWAERYGDKIIGVVAEITNKGDC